MKTFSDWLQQMSFWSILFTKAWPTHDSLAYKATDKLCKVDCFNIWFELQTQQQSKPMWGMFHV